MHTFIAAILSRYPVLGMFSSLLSVTLTHLQILQIIGAILGILIAVITAILKVIELRDKLAEKKKVEAAKRPRKKRVNSDDGNEDESK